LKSFTKLVFLISLIMAKPYRGGELRTIDTYRYGRYEVRMKSAAGDGVVSSFFTYRDYWADGYTGSQHWNEIDWEWLGNYDDKAQTNLITQYEWSHVELIDLEYNPHEEYHNYAFEWTPDYVAFFVDDELVRYDDNFYVDSLYHYQKLMMNIWQPTYVDWVGEFNPDILPVYAFYDWVKYYAFVPGSGNTGTDNNFIMLWEDDFNNWNTDRWEKATHTWDGNNVDFIEENVVFHEGEMILCMTTPNNTGYEPEGPEHILNNAGFESNFDHWSVWPENLTNYSIVNDPILHGYKSLKLNGQNSGITNSTAIYQTFNPATGEEFVFSGFCYVSSDDPLLGENSTFLEITFFDENWNLLGEQYVSSPINSSSPTDQWIQISAVGNAPTGVVNMNVAIIFEQENDAGGSAYFDDMSLFLGNLSSMLEPVSSYEFNFRVFPNPFNNITTISFDVLDNLPTLLTIYNLMGQPVRTIKKDQFSLGTNQIKWNGKNDAGFELPTGIYFAELASKNFSQVQKIMLLK